jgi:trehalose 6-phosphate phosphatase
MNSAPTSTRKRRVPARGLSQLPAPDAASAYFFDVDGTLAEIAATPSAARVEQTLLDQLGSLSRLTRGAVALVSGRSIADLDRLLGALRLPVAGQHGAERRTMVGGIIRHPYADERMEWLRQRVRERIARHTGILVEDKGSAIALHYRQAPSLAAFAHREARQLAAEFGAGIAVLRGKAVVELLASGQDKGRAVLDFMHETPFRGRRPVFVGDDVSDEPGFFVVNARHGLSIKVGPGATQAHWRLAGVSEVSEWLARAL